MRLPALAALCFFSACSSEPLPPACSGGDIFPGTGGGPTPELILLTGQQADVVMSIDAAASCDAPPAATGVDSAVLGPDNLPLASTHGAPTSPDEPFSAYNATVSFTPLSPGDYHLQARFQPNLGIAQLNLRAAIDLSQVAAHDTYSNLGCVQMSVTAHGTVLCVTASDGVMIFRSGAKVGSHSGNLVSVQGDSVWLAEQTDVHIWHFNDTGSGPLVAATPATFVAPSPINQLIPGTDDVVVLTIDQVVLYTATGSTFQPARTWTGVSGAFAGSRNGDDLIVASANSVFGNLDGGTELSALTGDYLTSLGCGPEGLWFLDNQAQLRLYTPGSRLLRATLSPPLNPPTGIGWVDVSPTAAYGLLPFAAAAPSRFYVPTWDPVSQQLFLTNWGPTAAGMGGFVSAQWAVLLQSDGVGLVVKQAPQP